LGAMIALISSGTTGIAVKAFISQRYVTKEYCEQKHETDECRDDLMRQQQTKDMRELKRANDVQFRMIRALVTYSDIPAPEKEKILNTSREGNG